MTDTDENKRVRMIRRIPGQIGWKFPVSRRAAENGGKVRRAIA